MVNLQVSPLTNGLRKSIAFVLASAVFLNPVFVGGSNNAVAREMTEALPGVVPADVVYNGSFSQRIDFKVPAFRGLEPRLGLSYDSGRVSAYGPGNLVGAGWRLTGLSTIQRANPRRAVPRFNGNDIWMLDGQELVSCGSYTGAGCGAGATHATAVENYQRIKQVTTNNTWEVTSRDGTKYIYKPIGNWAASATVTLTGDKRTHMLSQYRYLLAEKISTTGKQVTFSYACGADLDCRISLISYDIGQVRFHWEERPDKSTYAAGHMLGKVATRLRSVEVRAAGSMLRTYELLYSVSPATKRSLLTSVRERGRNSVVGTGGVITAGTALPAYTFQYTGAASNPVQVADIPAEESLPHTPSQYSQLYNCGQFGNDRKVYCVVRDSNNRMVTTENPPRHVYNYNSYYPYYDFFFIQEALNAPKKVVTVPWRYHLSGGEKRRDHDSVYGRPRLIGDFDGDGLDDITGADGSPVQQRYTAAGSAGNWGGYGDGGNSAADLNGDGLVDIYDPQGTHLDFHLSNGKNSFELAYTHNLHPFHGEFRAEADFNGDGTTDFLIANNDNGSYKIYHTVGETIVAGASFSHSNECFPQCGGPVPVDANGDGLSDLIVNIGGEKARLYLNEGDSFSVVTSGGSTHEFDGYHTAVIDVDGDGVSELVKKDDYWKAGFGAKRWAIQSERPDVMKFVKTPLGAETKISYERYQPAKQIDLPPNVFVVKSIETYDGRDVRATTDYSYSGPKWHWGERQFLGFEKITATLPRNFGETGSPVVETTYMQDIASVGRVKQVLRKDHAGTVLQKRDETYVVNTGSKPFTSLNTNSYVTTYYNGVARTKREERRFNAFGLVDKTISHGDASKTGDERIHTRWPYANTAQYIVNRWAIETINIGTAYNYTNGRRWRRWHYYDNANSAVTQPPVKGLKTQTSEWTGGGAEDKVPQVVRSYDTHGNVSQEADGLGNTTNYIYESSFNIFPVEVRNPLYPVNNAQKTLMTWDKVCGVVLTETDVNGSVTSHTYDNLCRKVRTNLPDGGVISFEYQNWGTPGSSYNRTKTKHPNGDPDIVQDVFFDGFGRTYLEETSG